MRKECERDAVHACVKARSHSGDQARGCGFGGLGPEDAETLYSRPGGRQRRERAGLRDGFGGSTIHLDGMGTLTAAGIVKSVILCPNFWKFACVYVGVCAQARLLVQYSSQ